VIIELSGRNLLILLKKGKIMGEVLFIIALIGGLVGWTFLLRKKARLFWLITMSIIGGTVGVMEVVAKITHDVTISQMYWRWSVNNVALSWVCMGMVALGIGSLIWHLQAKVISGENYKDGKEI